MKGYCNIKTTLRIAMQGKVVTKVLTVFLCAFSFALFALASTGYTYDLRNTLVRAYSYMVQNTYPYITFENEQNEGGNRNYAIGQERIDRIHAELGDDFAYVYDGLALPVMQILYERFFYDKPQVPFLPGSALSGEEELFEALGYTLLAGRYPEAADEIVVPKTVVGFFQEYGYYDSSVNYIKLIDGCFEDGTPYYDPETNRPRFEGIFPPPDHTGYYYFDREKTGERVAIEQYSDMLGRQFVLYGDLEQGSVDENSMYAVTVVGVADGSSKITPTQAGGYYPVNHFLFSAAWHDALFAHGDDICTRLIAPPTDEPAYLRACVDLTLEFIEDYQRQNPSGSQDGVHIGAHDVYTLVASGKGISDERFVVLVGTAAGILFGVFSVLLCWHLTTSSLELKRRKIGILRSLGATEADVSQIVLTEALSIAACSFVLALAFTLAGFYGFLQGLSFRPDFGISILQLNGWNILILLALSFLVPLLCTVMPLRRFLKKPIVDNITGNRERK